MSASSIDDLSKPIDMTPEVMQMNTMSITGNVTPMAWYKNIAYKNGKPHLPAILILSDIVYWYRPTQVRDEITGQVTGLKKKFKGAYLQRSLGQFSATYGLTKKQSFDGTKKLEELGVIKKHTRTIETKSGKIPNVLYIELIPDVVNKITYEVLPIGNEVLPVGNEALPISNTNTETSTETSTESIGTEQPNIESPVNSNEGSIGKPSPTALNQNEDTRQSNSQPVKAKDGNTKPANKAIGNQQEKKKGFAAAARPAAADIFHQVVSRQMPKTQWTLVSRVEDMVLWKLAVEYVIGRGTNPMNINYMLDVYKNPQKFGVEKPQNNADGEVIDEGLARLMLGDSAFEKNQLGQ